MGSVEVNNPQSTGVQTYSRAEIERIQRDAQEQVRSDEKTLLRRLMLNRSRQHQS